MAIRNRGAAPLITKRQFLQHIATIGGASATMTAMNAWSMNAAGWMLGPPQLDGEASGKSVVILGAGITGLVAAYELSRRGYQVRVLEARPFSGGRCQTARGGHKWTDINGVTHECAFDPGEYLNHGPWRVPANHDSILHYIRKFNVPMEVMINYNEDGYLRYANAKGSFKDKRVRMREVMADMRAGTAELFAKSIDQGQLDDAYDSDAKAQLIDYLVNEGMLDKSDLSYKGNGNRGYKVAPGAGTDPGAGIPADPYPFDDLLESGLGNSFRSVSSQIMFQPVGGMDQIAMAFEGEIGRLIIHNAEVLEIRQEGKGVRVPYRDTQSGEVNEVTADFCISTVPPTIISKLKLDVSDACKAALQAPTGFPVSKLGLQMNRRFWEEDDNIFGGSSRTDFPGNNSLAYPSGGLFGKKGVILAGYNFRDAATRMGGMSGDERVEIALANGEKLHPGQFRENYSGKFAYKGWHLTRYSMGGWESWSDDARSNQYPVILEPQGRIIFAGSYATYKGGWLSGAVESAWQQIEKLHHVATSG